MKPDTLRVAAPGGAELYVESYGEPAGASPIVFLNGMTQTTSSWKTQARAIRDRCPVITYDARAQGESEAGDLDITLDRHADDLKLILDELEVERARLVGFSHGARVGLGFAARHAERVERIAIVGATARSSARARAIVRSWSESLRLGGLEAMSWVALPSILGEAFLAETERMASAMVRASVARNDPDGVRRLLDALAAYPSLAELAPQVRAPALVIRGADDLLADAAGARELAAALKAHYIEIADCGHTAPIEAPQAWRDAALPFLLGDEP